MHACRTLRCRGGGGGASKAAKQKHQAVSVISKTVQKSNSEAQTEQQDLKGGKQEDEANGKKKSARFAQESSKPKPISKVNSMNDLLERTKDATSSWAGPQGKESQAQAVVSPSKATGIERAKTPAPYSIRGDQLTMDLLEATRDVVPQAQKPAAADGRDAQQYFHPFGAIAQQPFQAEDEFELSIQPGDVLLICNAEDLGWLSALKIDFNAGPEGMPFGYVPETFVQREDFMPAVVMEEFLARDDSTLTVHAGEVVGILGYPPGENGWAVAFKGEGTAAPYGPGCIPRRTLVPSTCAVALSDHHAASGLEVDLQKGQLAWFLPYETADGWAEVITVDAGIRGLVPYNILREVRDNLTHSTAQSGSGHGAQSQQMAQSQYEPRVGLTPPEYPEPAQTTEGEAAADAMQAAFAQLEEKVAREVEATKEQAARDTEAAKQQAEREADMARKQAAKEAEAAKAQAALKVEEANRATREAEATAKEAEEAARRAQANLAEWERKQKSEGAAMRTEVEQLKAELDASKLQLQAEQTRADAIEKQWIAEATQRRQLHNKLQDMVGSLRVSCRVRPITSAERNAGAEEVVEVKRAKTGEIVSVLHQAAGESAATERRFDFTHIYGQNSRQEDIFQDTEPLMTSVLDGYNVCIFAYGQSGTGKTYTMEGTSKEPGLAPRAMSRLFQVMDERSDSGNFEHECFLSMVEIYNENIRDLLADPSEDNSKKRYDIQRDPALGMYVRDLVTAQVSSAGGAQELITEGHTHRSVGVTNLNEQSSRSHMLLTLTVLTTNVRSGQRHVGKLSLCDLAGSERLSKIDTKGAALKETQAINKSLSALGSVLNALARNEAHVPYRDSKLTYLLQDSLGGNAKTLMLVACGPTKESSAETVSSLQFASRAKAVTMGPAKVNQKPKEKEKEKDARPITRSAPRVMI